MTSISAATTIAECCPCAAPAAALPSGHCADEHPEAGSGAPAGLPPAFPAHWPVASARGSSLTALPFEFYT